MTTADNSRRSELFPLPTENVEAAKLRFLAAVDTQPDRWWTAPELREAADIHGTLAMIAVCELANPEHDGRLELDPRLRVRRPR